MRYYLDITIKTDTKSTGASAAKGETKAEEVATNEKNSVISKFGKTLATGYASTALLRQAVHSEIGLISVETGNSYEQRVMEGTMSVAESAIGLGLTFAVSRVAGVVALAGKAISTGYEARRRSEEIAIQDLNAQYVRNRAGLSFNRSRQHGSF